jgi:predicted glycosyltransferase
MDPNAILEAAALPVVDIQGKTSGSAPISAEAKRRVAHKKIWIDIDNSPHVPFFKPIMRELTERGFEIILTARDTYQVCELLKFHNLSCKVIGRHYGKNKVFKVLGNCLRAAQLIPMVARCRPDLALSHGSRAQILVCAALGVPSIMMHDYEHSTKTGFVEPDWVLTPEVIPSATMSRRGSRTMKYPGLKEDVYIPQFQPDPSILKTLGLSPDNIVVTLRPPATEAHYHNPEAEELFAAALELFSSNPDVRAVTLPRSANQTAELRHKWADLIAKGRMIIPSTPVDGLNLIWFSDLVISGGGTMNREAAALGVPVYSIFRGKIGAVDRYLAAQGRLMLLESVEDVKTKVQLKRREKPLQMRLSRPEAMDKIVGAILQIAESECR